MPQLNLMPLQVEVSARQFEWRMRYPSPVRWQEWKANKDAARDFAVNPHMDDVHVVNELHVWKDHPVVVQLRTIDVLHSFNIPLMRVKQDSLPGKIIPVWFTPTKKNVVFRKDKAGHHHWDDGFNPDTGKSRDKHQMWDIACAELCGWGHYRMIGRVYVHEDEADFVRWLEEADKRQHSKLPDTPTTAAH